MPDFVTVLRAHRVVGSSSGFLALCSCGDAVDDHPAHVAEAIREVADVTFHAPACTLCLQNGMADKDIDHELSDHKNSYPTPEAER